MCYYRRPKINNHSTNISVKCSNIINSTLKKLNYKIFKIFNFKIENLQKGFKRKNLNYKKVGDNYCICFEG